MRRKRGSSTHSKKSRHSRSPSKSPQKSAFYKSPKKVNISPPKPQIKDTFFDKIFKIYSTHTRLGELFLIHFSFIRPQNGLDNLDSIPDLINFRFHFGILKNFTQYPELYLNLKNIK